MKKLLLFAGMACLLCQCAKDTGSFYKDSHPDLISQARSYFQQNIESASPVYTAGNPGNPRTRAHPAALWDNAYIIPFRNSEAVMVPLHYPKDQFLKTSFGGNNFYRLDNAAHLLLYRDSLAAWHAELVTALPDTAYLKSKYDADFSGLVLVDDWWGNPLHKYLFSPDGKVKQPGVLVANVWEETCYYMDGYNYSSGDPDGYYWLESLGCTYSDLGGNGYPGLYYGPAGKAGGAGPPKYPPNKILRMPPPTNVIASIQSYFQCFQNVPGAIYQATVCVNQPSPGSRNPWVIAPNTGSSSGGSPVDVGHTFLVLTEVIPGNNGPTTITRNVGFYPAYATTPFGNGVQGVLNNDETHEYNISGTFNVGSGDLFFAILGYLSQGNNSGYIYNINNNNCTTFAIDALAAGHIYLPSTIGYWLGGLGNDPGDLGEDLRTNNFTGMVRSTLEQPHSNAGQCN